MTLEAGRLRHRIDIERREDVQDPDTGATQPRWVVQYARLPAAVEPLSAREFIAAQALQSEISGRITIRFLTNITAKHRVRHGDRIYNIAGPPLPDKESGREYLTLLISDVEEAYESEYVEPTPSEVVTPFASSMDVTVDSDNLTADAV